MKLRDYQEDAVSSAMDSLNEPISELSSTDRKKALIVAATGAGKSVMMAELAKRWLDKWPSGEYKRILFVVHDQRLVAQNSKTFKGYTGNEDVGIYCAGLGFKDTDNQVIFASRQSLGKNPNVCGSFQLIIIDEVHSVSFHKKDGEYNKILDCQTGVPVVGFTATPYRLDNGFIYGDDDRCLFPRISYEIGAKQLIEQGFLSRPSYPDVLDGIEINTKGIKRSGGDFVKKDISRLMMGENLQIVNDSLDIWERQAKGRKVTIAFACSIEHGEALHKEATSRGISAVLIHSKTAMNRHEKEQLLNDIKEARYSLIININMLTTGFDAPIVDCILLLRPTLSAQLFVQMIGRGLRLHPGKEDCLILDLAGNHERFGDIYNPIIPDKKKRKKSDDFELVKPTYERDCFECWETIPEGETTCPHCRDNGDREARFLKEIEMRFKDGKKLYHVDFVKMMKTNKGTHEQTTVMLFCTDVRSGKKKTIYQYFALCGNHKSKRYTESSRKRYADIFDRTEQAPKIAFPRLIEERMDGEFSKIRIQQQKRPEMFIRSKNVDRCSHIELRKIGLGQLKDGRFMQGNYYECVDCGHTLEL